MITTLRLCILTCVVVSEDEKNSYINQLHPIAFNNAEDAEKFVMSNESVIFKDVEDEFIIWYVLDDDKLFYYTLWF